MFFTHEKMFFTHEKMFFTHEKMRPYTVKDRHPVLLMVDENAPESLHKLASDCNALLVALSGTHWLPPHLPTLPHVTYKKLQENVNKDLRP